MYLRREKKKILHHIQYQGQITIQNGLSTLKSLQISPIHNAFQGLEKKNSVVKLLKSTRVGSPTNINRLVGNLSYHPFLKITGFPGSRWLNHQFQNGGNPNLEDDGSSPTKNNGETRKPTKNKNGNWTSRDFLLLFLVFFLTTHISKMFSRCADFF